MVVTVLKANGRRGAARPTILERPSRQDLLGPILTYKQIAITGARCLALQGSWAPKRCSSTATPRREYNDYVLDDDGRIISESDAVKKRCLVERRPST